MSSLPHANPLEKNTIPKFELLVAELWPTVLRIVQRRIPDPDLAAEAVSDAFMKLPQHIHKLRARGKRVGWLIRVAINYAISKMRAIRGNRATSMSAIGDAQNSGGGWEPADVGPAPDEEAESEVTYAVGRRIEDIQQRLEALRHLWFTEEEQVYVRLSQDEDLNNMEIAVRWQMPNEKKSPYEKVRALEKRVIRKSLLLTGLCLLEGRINETAEKAVFFRGVVDLTYEQTVDAINGGLQNDVAEGAQQRQIVSRDNLKSLINEAVKLLDAAIEQLLQRRKQRLVWEDTKRWLL
jgi:DNA-directed RNA polymerase specialized sigma24 family protein